MNAYINQLLIFYYWSRCDTFDTFKTNFFTIKSQQIDSNSLILHSYYIYELEKNYKAILKYYNKY